MAVPCVYTTHMQTNNMTKHIARPSDYAMAQSMHDQYYCRRPMAEDGDFDDHFTAEDYNRRRYQRDGWGTVPGDRWV